MDRPQNLLNLTTHQLQYLVAMEHAATLREAADELGVSTSALSQALSELERRVGLALFERRGRSRSLTERGREMAGHAERVLAATRDLTIWAQAAAEGRQGAVHLGLIDTAAVGYFPDALLRFRADRPDVELRLTVAPSGELLGQVADGRLDLAVVVEPPGGRSAGSSGQAPDAAGPPGEPGSADRESPVVGHPDLVATPLLTDAMAVYGPPGPGGGRDQPIERWGPWVTFPPSSHTRSIIATALGSLGASFEVEAVSHQPEILRQLVLLGMGWTVLPVVQAETEPNPLVRARRAPLLTRRLVVLRRRSAPLDPTTSELIARLRRAADDRPGPG